MLSFPLLVFSGISLPALGILLMTRDIVENNTLNRVLAADPRPNPVARVEDGVIGPALASMAFAIVLSSTVFLVRRSPEIRFAAAGAVIVGAFACGWINLARRVAQLPVATSGSIGEILLEIIKDGFNQRGQELVYVALSTSLFLLILRAEVK